MLKNTLTTAIPLAVLFGLLAPRSSFAFVVSSSPQRMTTTSQSPLQMSSSGETLTTVPPVTVASPDHPLIQRANELIYTKTGFYSAYDPDVFSEDFVFRGPSIGPLTKKDYFSTMDTFKLYEAFPDFSPNAFGFHIDPIDPNRVWFMVRNTGTFTGAGISLGNGITYPANGAKLEGAPETYSIVFDENKKIKHLTVGYVSDRFEGNTKGKGAAFGIFKAIGLPFPSPGPLLKFAQWFGTEIANDGAYSYSTENIPSWWKSKDKASEGFL
jgi:hypothetical protein